LWCYECPQGCDYFYFHMARPCADGKDRCIKIEQEGSPTVRGCSTKGVCTAEGLLQEGASAIANIFTETDTQKDSDCCEGILCNGYSQTINILVPVVLLVLILVFFGSCIGCICCCCCRK